MVTPPITFYLPPAGDTPWPETIEAYWPWMQAQQIKYPGPESWILQTYLHLKAAHFPCQLSGQMPDRGIIVAHRYAFKNTQKPNPTQLFICARDDKFIHPYAQHHIVQNARQTQRLSIAALWRSTYMPLWPQIGLIPRDPARGSRFETLTYLGDPDSLAPELKNPAWPARLKALGVQWQVNADTATWSDYSATDAILAIRSFDGQPHHHKPASKLLNAWLAGVPAILGAESAYQNERRSPDDYLEAATVAAAFAAIKGLKEDPARRQRLINQGHQRAQEISATALRNRWINFLTGPATEQYHVWGATPEWQQQAFLDSRRQILHRLDGIQRRRGIILQPS
jgi:hypothetical protein